MSEYKLTRDDLERAARVVYQTLGLTPQFAWPLLGAELNADVWVKHENFTPTGAFTVRGGLVYFHELLAAGPRFGLRNASTFEVLNLATFRAACTVSLSATRTPRPFAFGSAATATAL